jgi:hypothetical protein
MSKPLTPRKIALMHAIAAVEAEIEIVDVRCHPLTGEPLPKRSAEAVVKQMRKIVEGLRRHLGGAQ